MSRLRVALAKGRLYAPSVERFSRAQGVYSLSASKADELAAETKELGHSLLTYALLAGVRAAEGGENALVLRGVAAWREVQARS